MFYKAKETDETGAVLQSLAGKENSCPGESVAFCKIRKNSVKIKKIWTKCGNF
jgi:hypothetical protein